MNRTDRLLGLLLELEARGTVRAIDLARRFEVSLRTIYRDLQGLSESGVPLVATPGKGYQLLEGYFLPPLSFTAGEAAVLILGAEFVQARVDPEVRRHAESVLAKLSAVLPPEKRTAVARWRRELSFSGPGHRVDEAVLGGLRVGVQERRVVRLRYSGRRRATAEEREVEPISLVYLDERWYLAAYCRARQAPRFFRLDRIDEFRVLQERFELGPRHDRPPEEHTLSRDRPGALEARVRFDPGVIRRVREQNLYLFLREEVDARGPIFVYRLREDHDQDTLLHWLLGWGATAEVLAPPPLRARLAAEATVVAERHATPLDRQHGGDPTRPHTLRSASSDGTAAGN